MDIAVTNVHLDLGSGRRGTDMGPSALHVAGLLEELASDGHTIVDVQEVAVTTREITSASASDVAKARFLPQIAEACGRLADRVHRTVAKGQMPLVLGGDHSVAVGTLAGLARARGEQRTGVLWVDAHADFNTPETTPSGNIHGMPLAAAIGIGPEELTQMAGTGRPALRPEDIVILGARDIDPGEADLLRAHDIRVMTMTEIDRRGLVACVEEALERLTAASSFHLSFDLDAVDPQFAPGVGTPVPGGLSIRESHLVCEMAAQTGALGSVELVELNPTLDHANQTGRLAVWLIQSALGKSIL